MIVVDLRSGTFYQKCYDPECQAIDYRSPSRPLPPEICPTIFSPDRSSNVWRGSSNETNTSPSAKTEPSNGDPFLSDEMLYHCIMQDPSLWP